MVARFSGKDHWSDVQNIHSSLLFLVLLQTVSLLLFPLLYLCSYIYLGISMREMSLVHRTTTMEATVSAYQKREAAKMQDVSRKFQHTSAMPIGNGGKR